MAVGINPSISSPQPEETPLSSNQHTIPQPSHASSSQPQTKMADTQSVSSLIVLNQTEVAPQRSHSDIVRGLNQSNIATQVSPQSNNVHLLPKSPIIVQNEAVCITRPSFSEVVSGGIQSHLQDNSFFEPSELKPTSWYQGKPVVLFRLSDKQLLVDKLKYVLVGKFSHGRPVLLKIKEFFAALKLKSACNISVFDKKHIFIECGCKVDYYRIWLKLVWFIEGFTMRILKWTAEFNPSTESAIVPVWIRLEGLPLYLFDEMSLLSIANSIGKPIRVDPRNVARTIVNSANICVELDVSQPLLEDLWVTFEDDKTKTVIEGIWVKVLYDVIPPFCGFCSHLGHAAGSCKRREEKLRQASDQQGNDLPAGKQTPSVSGSDYLNIPGISCSKPQLRMKQKVGTASEGPLCSDNDKGTTSGCGHGNDVVHVEQERIGQEVGMEYQLIGHQTTSTTTVAGVSSIKGPQQVLSMLANKTIRGSHGVLGKFAVVNQKGVKLNPLLSSCAAPGETSVGGNVGESAAGVADGVRAVARENAAVFATPRETAVEAASAPACSGQLLQQLEDAKGTILELSCSFEQSNAEAAAEYTNCSRGKAEQGQSGSAFDGQGAYVEHNQTTSGQKETTAANATKEVTPTANAVIPAAVLTTAAAVIAPHAGSNEEAVADGVIHGSNEETVAEITKAGGHSWADLDEKEEEQAGNNTQSWADLAKEEQAQHLATYAIEEIEMIMSTPTSTYSIFEETVPNTCNASILDLEGSPVPCSEIIRNSARIADVRKHFQFLSNEKFVETLVEQGKYEEVIKEAMIKYTKEIRRTFLDHAKSIYPKDSTTEKDTSQTQEATPKVSTVDEKEWSTPKRRGKNRNRSK